MSLLQQFTKGDLDAFEVLFRQFQGRVYAWIVRIVHDPGTAEDLTLETFWRIFRARGRFNPEADFGAWAYRIAVNLALSHLRRRCAEQELRGDESAGNTPDPALRQETIEQVRRAFARLPARLQVTATMALIEERPYPEIATILGIAPGTVKSRVFRAVRILRKQLSRMRVHT
ncbi:MAG TPA: sigma-70 family RNA polymerase sigma factor [Candidatus Angelobacter sp.]